MPSDSGSRNSGRHPPATETVLAPVLRSSGGYLSVSDFATRFGETSERDALPQAADYLATREGVETAVAFGIVEDGIQISARSTDSRIHIGNALNGAFADVGSAGGHGEMAGGEVPLGIFADDAIDDPQLFAIVENVMSARLVAEFNLSPETDA